MSTLRPLLARRLSRVTGRDRRANGRMRTQVCVVGSGWRFMSGISVYTCRLSNALADEFDVSVILMRRLLPERLYPGATRVGADLVGLEYRHDVAVFDGVDYYWWPSILRALRFVGNRPDVYVFEWWTGTVLHSYLLLAAAARLRGARVVIEFHEVLDTGEAARLLPRLYVKLLLRPLLALSANFVVHSEFDRAAVSAHYGLDPARVLVVPHGPYDHLGSSSSTAPRADRGDGVCDVLFFGTIRPYKGLEYLLEAFDSLTAEEAARYRLWVVGETWEGWTRPAEQIEASPHRDRITFVNRYVPDSEVSEYFARADAVVLPYTRSSSSGPLHIAMSHGLPVAVTPVGGLVEAAGGYEGTRFVKPHDSEDLRAALLELPDMARTRYADPHSWGRSVELLRPVLHGPGGDGATGAGGGGRTGAVADGVEVAPGADQSGPDPKFRRGGSDAAA